MDADVAASAHEPQPERLAEVRALPAGSRRRRA
jgi:hypothetical protein